MIKCRFNPNMVVALGPNNAGSDAHQNVKCGPNWREKLTGWCKDRFVEGQVPIIYRALGSYAGQEANGKADQNAYGYVNKSFFHDWYNFD